MTLQLAIGISTLAISILSLVFVLFFEFRRICIAKKEKIYKRKYKAMNDLCLMLKNEFRNIYGNLFLVMDEDENGNPYITYSKVVELSENIINSYIIYIGSTHKISTEIKYEKGQFYAAIKFKE